MQTIVNQLQRKQETPLTKAEREAEATKQFLRLQAMASEKNEHRVRKLQAKINPNDLPFTI